ncbi:P-loop containing nucleoside triphosphate hydrolase protein [Polychytrium aggregatum]|uniref:P-loop containing nucleoside triphosphate hydrolase protein n=1 Tax=Polychytrium aggregatum TaxID=110093 RepID=UPI0022FDE6CB|nr:P-loop containing nucleoside triphosphate hydrolase protein [Polychytrium aggregatum]KAI9203656.1 P-loop containing nucleoside triphosphate hydrolase protein [Polychytrium aggregatum]
MYCFSVPAGHTRNPVAARANLAGISPRKLPGHQSASPSKPHIILHPMNPLSFVTLSWLSGLLRTGSSRKLDGRDIEAVTAKVQSDVLIDLFRQHRDRLLAPSLLKDKTPPTPKAPVIDSKSLFMIYCRLFFWRWLASFLCSAINMVCRLVTPLILYEIIEQLSGRRSVINNGYALAFLMFLANLGAGFSQALSTQIATKVSADIKALIISNVYEKSYRLNAKSMASFSEGYQLVLVTVDSDMISNVAKNAEKLVLVPIEVAVTMFLLSQFFGLRIVTIGALVTAACLLLCGGASIFLGRFQRKMLSANDSRVSLLEEILVNIRTVKLQCWESLFENRVSAIRGKMLSGLAGYLVFNVILLLLVLIVMYLLPSIVFGAFLISNSEAVLTANIAFPSLSLLGQLESLFVFPVATSAMGQANVSWKRFASFYCADEVEAPLRDDDESSSDAGYAIRIQNGYFRWDSTPPAPKRKRFNFSKFKQSLRRKHKPQNDGGLVIIQDYPLDPVRIGSDLDKATNGLHKDNPSSQAGLSASHTTIFNSPSHGSSIFGEVLLSKSSFDSSGSRASHGSQLPLFENINLTIQKGSLVAIVGKVGSGKSSIFSGIIGHMSKLSGTTTISGKLAYVPQQPWIKSGSIRDNIVLESDGPDTCERLDRAVRCCALGPDLDMLPAGIHTQLGERGVNLSGGQKARIALARAVFSDADVFLLDNPLTALDTTVAKQVFEDCIASNTGILGDKTRVVITNQLSFLPLFDRIIIVDKGRIVHDDTYEHLIQLNSPEDLFVDIEPTDDEEVCLSQENMAAVDSANQIHSNDVDDTDELETPKPTSGSEQPAQAQPTQSIIASEELRHGSVGRKAYLDYYRYTSGYLGMTLQIICVLLIIAANISATLWLNAWMGESSGMSQYDSWMIYAILNVLRYSFTGLFVIVTMRNSFVGSRRLHARLVQKILSAPLSFFESQPVGRILNRLSKDMEYFDQFQADDIMNSFWGISSLFCALFYSIYAAPWIVGFYVPIAWITWKLYGYLRMSLRQLKRLDSNKRGTLNSHIAESFSGMLTIRTNECQDKFIAKQRVLTDESSNLSLYLACSYIWIEFRLCVVIALFTLAFLAIAMAAHVPAELIALALIYIVDFPAYINYFGTYYAQVEQGMNTIERFSFYLENVESEEVFKSSGEKPEEPDWPSSGRIQFEDLEIIYPSRPNRPALADINLDIAPGEKVAIAGRTASGKSTVLNSLFRLVRPSKGRIVIDDRDIQNVDLGLLRRKIQILPQEVVLFHGTIRSNIDMEGMHSDQTIWGVLESLGIKDEISALPNRLESEVLPRGENLSLGQRQLLCVARALAANPKILVMDESSSSLDKESNAALNQVIMEAFSDSTVLNITHRLETVRDFDRIVVLNAGRIQQIGAPGDVLTMTPKP